MIPPVLYAKEDDLKDCIGLKQGEKCDFQCKDGYKRIGIAPICLKADVWDVSNTKCLASTIIYNNYQLKIININ